MAYQIEVTDTFGGEANYSWVRRYTYDAKSALGAVQKLAREHGSGWRKAYIAGDDMVRYDLKGSCVCCFVDWVGGRMRTTEFKKFVRNPYVWPGGYPMYAITTDCGCLCKKCATDNAKQIIRSTRSNAHDGWAIAGVDVNWENNDLYCDHCNDLIESAYGEAQ